MKLRFLIFIIAAAAAPAQDSAQDLNTVTFHKQVEPILQRNCQSCHRPGQVAPMSFLTYQSVRPWARAIKAAVALRKMPPWFADPRYGPYLNDRSLKQSEIDTIVKWADSGAPEGDAKDAPVAMQWPEGWYIKPDIIVDGPATDVPASPKNNVVEWITTIMPTGFTKDTWVTSVQIKPEFPAVTHHICIGYIPHNPAYRYGVAYWTDKERGADGSALPDKGPTFLGPGTARASSGNPTPIASRAVPGGLPPPGGAEDCYLPGNFAADYRPINAAKLIPAGSDITFNLHYTPNGPGRHRSRESWLHGGTGTAREALHFVSDHIANRSQALRHSSQRWKLGKSRGRSYVPPGCRAGFSDAAHAFSRQGHDLHSRVPRREEANHSQRAAL